MNTKKKTPIGWKGIVRILVLSLCGIIIGFNIYLANANSLVGNRLPMPFGYGAAVVLSGSMEPQLSIDDLIVVKEANEYKVNDVVVYQDGNLLVVHRIIAIDGDEITTKGDANNTADTPIASSLIKGRVVASIPFVGKIVGFIKTLPGSICVIAVAVLLIEIPRRNEKKKDDAERQAIIDEINRLREQK